MRVGILPRNVYVGLHGPWPWPQGLSVLLAPSHLDAVSISFPLCGLGLCDMLSHGEYVVALCSPDFVSWCTAFIFYAIEAAAWPM